MTWLASAWAKTSLWIKLAGLAVAAVAGSFFYLYLKAKGLEKEARDLRLQNQISKAGHRVAYLEGQKERNRARLAQIPEEEDRLIRQITDEKKKAEEARARIAGMSAEELVARLKELGYD